MDGLVGGMGMRVRMASSAGFEGVRWDGKVRK